MKIYHKDNMKDFADLFNTFLIPYLNPWKGSLVDSWPAVLIEELIKRSVLPWQDQRSES